MDPSTIKALSIFPDQFEQFFYEIPENSRHWSPKSWEGVPSEALNPIEQICHVRDVEIEGYHVRFHRMLTENTPILDSLDGYELVQQNNYATADPTVVFNDINNARIQTIKTIENLTKTQLKRTAEFDGYGRLTVSSLIHYLCSHDQQHLSGLQWLLGKIKSNA